VDDVDDAGPNVELDEIDVELDDGTALILGEELINGVRVGNIVHSRADAPYRYDASGGRIR